MFIHAYIYVDNCMSVCILGPLLTFKLGKQNRIEMCVLFMFEKGVLNGVYGDLINYGWGTSGGKRWDEYKDCL